MDLLLILIVVLIILLVWRGPTMLPQLGEALGRTVKSVRESVDRDASPSAGDAEPPVARATRPGEAEEAGPPVVAESAGQPAEAEHAEPPPAAEHAGLPARAEEAATPHDGDPERPPGP